MHTIISYIVFFKEIMKIVWTVIVNNSYNINKTKQPQPQIIWIQKWSRHMTYEIHILVWERHTHLARLNWLNAFQLSLDNWNNNVNSDINNTKHEWIRFHSLKKTHMHDLDIICFSSRKRLCKKQFSMWYTKLCQLKINK